MIFHRCTNYTEITFKISVAVEDVSLQNYLYINSEKYPDHQLKNVAELIQLIKEVGKKLDLLEYKGDQYKPNICSTSCDVVQSHRGDVNASKCLFVPCPV